MLKWSVTFLFVILLTSCGKPAPVISGIDFPPENTAPTNVASQNPEGDVAASQNANVEENQGVKIFNAPLVLIRGNIDQYKTAMNASPGA